MEAVALCHGDLTPAKYRAAWRAILSAGGGSASGGDEGPRIVLGTRPAITAPIRNLGGIVILECDSRDLKQYDQNPRFDARTAALRRAETASADLLLMARAPRTEEYALVGNGFAFSEEPVKDAPAVLVNASGPAGRLEGGTLTPAAIERLERAWRDGKKALVFHNRRGSGRVVACRDCRRLLRCAVCDMPSVPHGEDLHCHHCGAQAAMPAVCPSCGGPRLALSGAGTASLEAFLGKRFPETIVARVDADDLGSGPGASFADAGILIGTNALLHRLSETRGHVGQFGAAIITSLEDLLGHPGFRTAEDAWRLVRAVRDIASADGVDVLLQSVDPDEQRIRRMLLPYRAFADSELAARRELGYPPFGTLVAIIASGDTEDIARGKAARLTDVLRKNAQTGTTVNGPLRPGTPYRHGKWRSVVAIKCPSLDGALERAISTLPDEFIVDRDPEYLT